MIKEIIKKNRSYRKFYQDEKISRETLYELIDLARYSSSGGNLQPLKYIISYKKDENDIIFSFLKWAAYFKNWNGPEEGEKPSAYIVVVGDKKISSNYFWDHGIACQSILLGACEKGLGGCMFNTIDRQGLREALQIPEQYEILVVIALGKPKEMVILEEAEDPEKIKYWRDENEIHHVPKRKLQDIILDYK